MKKNQREGIIFECEIMDTGEKMVFRTKIMDYCEFCIGELKGIECWELWFSNAKLFWIYWEKNQRKGIERLFFWNMKLWIILNSNFEISRNLKNYSDDMKISIDRFWKTMQEVKINNRPSRIEGWYIISRVLFMTRMFK